MAWYDEALFYHIYPLGLCGAPKSNPCTDPVPRLRELWPWVEHMKTMGVSALYIGRFSNPEATVTTQRTTGSWTAVWAQTRI